VSAVVQPRRDARAKPDQGSSRSSCWLRVWEANCGRNDNDNESAAGDGDMAWVQSKSKDLGVLAAESTLQVPKVCKVLGCMHLDGFRRCLSDSPPKFHDGSSLDPSVSCPAGSFFPPSPCPDCHLAETKRIVTETTTKFNDPDLTRLAKWVVPAEPVCSRPRPTVPQP